MLKKKSHRRKLTIFADMTRYMLIAIGWLLFLPLFLSAQPADDWGAFVQRIPIEAHQGKNFRLQAAVKVEVVDSTAEAEIWARVDKKDNRAGFFYNMMDKPIRSDQWQVYVIEGTIDRGAEHLAFGGLYSRQGRFYFDDFQLFVENDGGQLERIPIPSGDFEGDSVASHWGYLKQREGFALTATSQAPYHGKRSALVDGSGFVKPPTYGNNVSAGRTATVNGIELYYETYGEGEPLLLLHGNSQSILAFTHQIPEFEKHYRVIAVDTRGQGKSTEDGQRYTYELFAEDMKALLDELGLDSVNVVGWSDGGNTGLMLAMKYPAKVRKLVTMGANIYINNSVIDKSVRKEVVQRQEALAADTSRAAQNAARLMALLLTEPNRVYEDLRTIHCPVLVMAGENDIIKEAHTRGIVAHLPNGTLHIAAGEDHYFPVNNPSAFNEVVLDFLDD
ncbi:alpha/beta fold hydrolase [Parapedobacter pyrenivorans]|uniref:alpha/beta fold hydrolase n=1 Tax=Parapedobacter pyrenivorans TaxID=1305674 RepID=UPI00333E95DE